MSYELSYKRPFGGTKHWRIGFTPDISSAGTRYSTHSALLSRPTCYGMHTAYVDRFWVSVINFLWVSNGQSCLMMRERSWGMPQKKQCHPSNELASSVCYYKRHFPLFNVRSSSSCGPCCGMLLSKENVKGDLISVLPKNTGSMKEKTHPESKNSVTMYESRV